jgi:hypothetical protein
MSEPVPPDSRWKVPGPVERSEAELEAALRKVVEDTLGPHDGEDHPL